MRFFAFRTHTPTHPHTARQHANPRTSTHTRALTCIYSTSGMSGAGWMEDEVPPVLFTLRCAKDTVSFAKERTITREIGGPPLATLAKSKRGGFVLRLSQSRQCWPSYFPSWGHGFAISSPTPARRPRQLHTTIGLTKRRLPDYPPYSTRRLGRCSSRRSSLSLSLALSLSPTTATHHPSST